MLLDPSKFGVYPKLSPSAYISTFCPYGFCCPDKNPKSKKPPKCKTSSVKFSAALCVFMQTPKNSPIKFKFTRRFGFGNLAKFYGVKYKNLRAVFRKFSLLNLCLEPIKIYA